MIESDGRENYESVSFGTPLQSSCRLIKATFQRSLNISMDDITIKGNSIKIKNKTHTIIVVGLDGGTLVNDVRTNAVFQIVEGALFAD